MEEKDLNQIEAMMTRIVDRFQRETVEAFDQRIGILQENFQHKLDLVVEGQQGLAERMDRLEGQAVSVEERVQQQSGQTTGIAADLKAHRNDTEAHHKGWRVRED